MITDIERMPIATSTGSVDPKFREFKQNVEEALSLVIFDHSTAKLYQLSDKVLSEEEFHKAFMGAVGDKLIDRCCSDDTSSWDVDLNKEMFENPQLRIIDSFNIMYYYLKTDKSLMGSETKTTLFISRGEIYFTYRQERFKIISHFKPIVEEAI